MIKKLHINEWFSDDDYDDTPKILEKEVEAGYAIGYITLINNNNDWGCYPVSEMYAYDDFWLDKEQFFNDLKNCDTKRFRNDIMKDIESELSSKYTNNKYKGVYLHLFFNTFNLTARNEDESYNKMEYSDSLDVWKANIDIDDADYLDYTHEYYEIESIDDLYNIESILPNYSVNDIDVDSLQCDIEHWLSKSNNKEFLQSYLVTPF